MDSSNRCENYLYLSVNLRVKVLQVMNLNAPYRPPLLHEVSYFYAVIIFFKSLRTSSTLLNINNELNRPFRNPLKIPFLRRFLYEKAFNI